MNDIRFAIDYLEEDKKHVRDTRVYDLAITALEKQLTNGWIPCKLRQPTNEESIKRNGEFAIQNARVKLPYTATWNRGKKLWQDGEGYQLDYVTAWQPLPEPYIAD